VTTQWHLSTTKTSWVTGAAFWALSSEPSYSTDCGRSWPQERLVLVAAIMIVGALASAFSPSFVWLVMSRFVLGLGIGGDYPVSAVLMSEYSNRRDRGRARRHGLLDASTRAHRWSTCRIGAACHQELGKLSAGGCCSVSGAVPAAGVVYLRSKVPESPRFQARVQGEGKRAARESAVFSEGVLDTSEVSAEDTRRMGLREFLTNPRMLLLLVATAGSWFLFDYAYYGNTLSLPAILKGVDAHATLEAKLAWTLAIFAYSQYPVTPWPSWRMDRIGHKRLQLIGFSVMAVAFIALGAIPRLTSTVVPFLLVFGLSYFFVEFGPNTTTFVLPSEVFPVSMRTTGTVSPLVSASSVHSLGSSWFHSCSGTSGCAACFSVAACASVLGFSLSLVLPEPARRTLEDVSGEDDEARLRMVSSVALLPSVTLRLQRTSSSRQISASAARAKSQTSTWSRPFWLPESSEDGHEQGQRFGRIPTCF